jgi:hypothetical protein
MYGIHSYITTKRRRYYRCRRASQKGTCAARQIPAPVVERIVIDELRRLALDPERVATLAGEAQQTYEAILKPLIARRAQGSAELERIAGRLGSLLELAERRPDAAMARSSASEMMVPPPQTNTTSPTRIGADAYNPFPSIVDAPVHTGGSVQPAPLFIDWSCHRYPIRRRPSRPATRCEARFVREVL